MTLKSQYNCLHFNYNHSMTGTYSDSTISLCFVLAPWAMDHHRCQRVSNQEVVCPCKTHLYDPSCCGTDGHSASRPMSWRCGIVALLIKCLCFRLQTYNVDLALPHAWCMRWSTAGGSSLTSLLIKYNCSQVSLFFLCKWFNLITSRSFYDTIWLPPLLIVTIMTAHLR